jgi:uncharacterized membrane protein
MRRWLPASIIAGVWIFSIAVYSHLPEQMPVHWGISGEPNRYGSRVEGAFLMPAVMTVILALMQWYPSRDPRSANIAKFRGAYDTVIAATIAFMGAVHILALGNALGWQVDMITTVMVGLGALLIVFGNLLPRARSNFIFGIRTPWTLSSDSVWTRSHRVGGYAMVVAGLVTVVAAFLQRPIGIALALTCAMLAGLIPVVYSYIIWSRERGGPAA